VADGERVYSTDGGDLRRRQGRREEPSGPRLPDDGVVRILRGKGGRGGKAVTVVHGLPRAALADAARDLKRLCATGGAVKGAAIEIQGDHREKVAERLRAQGYSVKLAGG